MFGVIVYVLIVVSPLLVPMGVSAAHHIGELRKRTGSQTILGGLRPARRLA